MRTYGKFILSILLFWSIKAFSFEFSYMDDFSHFDGKPVVALWRGTNFVQEYFPDLKSQQDYIRAHGVGKPIYCAAAHKSTGIDFTAQLNARAINVLDISVRQIRRHFENLEKEEPITIDKQVFSTRRHAFQQKYTNSTVFIGSIGISTERKYKKILEGLPQGNPILSFSSEPKHAALYGYGVKNYGSLTALDPDYDSYGKPAHSLLGFIQAILLTNDVAKKAMAYNVVANHRAKNIKVMTNPRCNILSEREVSLVGIVPGESVVLTCKLRAPDLSVPYDHSFKEKFGLTKRRFDNARAVITDPQSPEEKKRKKVRDLIEKIIEGNQTDDLTHENTFTYRVQSMFEDIFEKDDLEYVPGHLDLSGQVRKKT